MILMQIAKKTLTMIKKTVEISLGEIKRFQNGFLNTVEKLDITSKDEFKLFSQTQLLVGYVLGMLMTLDRQIWCIYNNVSFSENIKEDFDPTK